MKQSRFLKHSLRIELPTKGAALLLFWCALGSAVISMALMCNIGIPGVMREGLAYRLPEAANNASDACLIAWFVSALLMILTMRIRRHECLTPRPE